MYLNEQLGLFEQIQACVVDELRSDDRVRAVWLGGSLGRGQGDALSDVDLVVVAHDGLSRDLVEASDRLISMVGAPALVHHAPQNAPLGGEHLNVLYDTNPLPIYIDWNFWPTVTERPKDVSVLLERSEPLPEADQTFQTMLAKMPTRVVTPKTEHEWDHFRVFMVPIVVKNAARGWFDSVHRVLEYMQRPDLLVASLNEAIKVGYDVLADSGKHETAESLACIRRYLSVIGDMAES